VARGISPHSGGTVPDFHRVPLPLAWLPRESSIGPGDEPMTLPRTTTLWLPVLLWAAGIFALSAIPSLNSGLGTWDYLLRKCAHVTEYAVLAVLLRRALGRDVPALLLASAYAVSDEFHQTFVAGRHGSPIDWGIDTVGALLGLALLRGRR
jgi:VanZ family protein